MLVHDDATSVAAAQNHFETLAEEKYVNAEFANLDAWIQEAQENLLRKRARSNRCGRSCDHPIVQSFVRHA